MEQDTEFTPVIFRCDRSGQFKGYVTAVFPCEPADYAGLLMTCYAHVAQHGGCGYQWYNTTRAAKPAEYADLFKELESIGYRLKVYKRIQPWMRDKMREQVRAWRALDKTAC